MDPIEFEAGDVNFYRYVGNDCVNFVDPLGLEWYKPWTWFDKPKTSTNKNCKSTLDKTIDGIEKVKDVKDATDKLETISDGVGLIKSINDNNETGIIEYGSNLYNAVPLTIVPVKSERIIETMGILKGGWGGYNNMDDETRKAICGERSSMSICKQQK